MPTGDITYHREQPARLDFSALSVGIVLVLTIAMPSISYMRGARSMGAGALAVAIAHLYLSFMDGVQHRSWPAGAAAAKAILALFACVTLSSGLSLLLYPEADFARTIGSELVFAVFMSGAYVVAKTTYLLPDHVVDKALHIVFYILVAAGVAGMIHFSPFSSTASKAVLFFNEPSHYSLSFLPFLFYMTVMASPKRRILFILLGFVLALVLQSLTLIVGILLICLTVLQTRHLLMIMPFAVLTLAYLSLDYYTDRLNFSEGSSNLSTLVFLSGWERAYLNIVETRGIGVGFQQFGVIGSHGKISDVISALAGERLGVLDGGTVGAKFVGEFGLVGVFILFGYVISIARKLLFLKRIDEMGEITRIRKDAIFIACFVMFSIDIFVRGIAYFSPSGFLFITSVIWFLSGKGSMYGWHRGKTFPLGDGRNEGG